MSRMRREIVMLCERWKDGKVKDKMIQVLQSRLGGRRLQTAKQPRHWWRLKPPGSSPVAPGEQSSLGVRLPTAYFDSLGVPRCWKRFRLTERNRRVRTRMSGWGDRGERATAPPMPIFAVKRFVRKAIQF